MNRIDYTRPVRGIEAMICMAALVIAVISHAASLDTPPDAWTENTDGGATISYEADGVVSVGFAAQSALSIPQYRSALLMANAQVSGGAFVGNYEQSGVKAVAFELANSLPAAQVVLVLQAADSGRMWRNPNVTLSESLDAWIVNSVSMDRSSGWTRDGGGDLDAMWAQDLQNVAMIGVRLTQDGHAEQTAKIRQFVLKASDGSVVAGPADLTDLQQALLARFGVSSLDQLSAEQQMADADGDGMTDVQELIAGTNPDSAASVFAAEVLTVDDEAGITIRWPSVAGAKYTVLRATNLMEGLQNLAVGMVATETGVMTYRDATATGDGPYFYKVRKE